MTKRSPKRAKGYVRGKIIWISPPVSIADVPITIKTSYTDKLEVARLVTSKGRE